MSVKPIQREPALTQFLEKSLGFFPDGLVGDCDTAIIEGAKRQKRNSEARLENTNLLNSI
jgi:hypothetical protein